MDANKFGCFVAERRKELNMTQKDLAAKIKQMKANGGILP